ncbi:MAG: hypothetical protein ABMA15_16850, partial [Vicinamibacterales bacterium]
AVPGALDLVRALRDSQDEPVVVALAATDPANPYGATLKWPAFATPGMHGDVASARQARIGRSGIHTDVASEGQAQVATSGKHADVAKEGRGPTRTVGALVILVDGALAAYLARGERQLLTWIPDAEPIRSRVARSVAHILIDRARAGGDTPRGMLIETIDNAPASTHALASCFVEAGFAAGAMGLQGVTRGNRGSLPSPSHA